MRTRDCWFWLAEHDPTSGELHVTIRAIGRGAVDLFHRNASWQAGPTTAGPAFVHITTRP